MSDTSEDLKEQKSIIHSLTKMVREMNSALEETKNIYDGAGVKLKSMKNLLSDTLKINSELYKNTASLGVNTANNFKTIKAAFTEATEGIGESLEEAKHTVSSLIEEGYIGNFTEATKTMSMFVKATGASRSEMAETVSMLNKSMKMSEDSISSVYASIIKIQQTNGLTKKGVDAVSASIKNVASNMKAFGSTEANVKTMSVGMARLASEMEKVGLSASKATALVEQLTDPERIKDNIGLYAQLGMSVSDALSGNFDSSQMNAGLVELGNRIKAMGPIAGKGFADAFGVSYKDAVKMADMQTIGEELVPPKDSFDVLNEALGKTQDSTEKLATTVNKMEGLFADLGPTFMAIMDKVGDRVEKLKDDVIKSIEEIVKKIKGENAIDEAGKKAKDSIKDNISEALKLYNEELGKIDKKLPLADRKARIKELRDQTLDLMSMNTEGASLTSKAKGFFNAVTHPKTSLGNAKVWFKDKKEDVGFKLKQYAVSRGNKASKRGIAKSLVEDTLKAPFKAIGSMTKFLGPIASVLGMLAPILTDALKNNEEFMKKIDEIMAKIKETLQPIIDTLIENLMPIVDILFNSLEPLLNMVLSLLTPLLQLICKLIEPLGNVLGGIISVLLEVLTPLLELVMSVLTPILEALAPILDLIGTVLKALAPLLGFLVKVINFLLTPFKIYISLVSKLFAFLSNFVSGILKHFIKTTDENTKKVEENTEQIKESGQEREHIRATSDGKVIATRANIQDNSATITKDSSSQKQANERKLEEQREQKEAARTNSSALITNNLTNAIEQLNNTLYLFMTNNTKMFGSNNVEFVNNIENGVKNGVSTITSILNKKEYRGGVGVLEQQR